MHYTLKSIVLLFFLQTIHLVSAANGDSGCNLFFCLNITVSSNDVMTFQVKPIWDTFGWVGLGWGRQMKDTHMVVLWDNTNGSRILSQRYGVGHVEPVVEANPPRRASMVEPGEPTWKTKSDSNHSVSAFQIPVNKSDSYPGTMIWAYSLRRPDPDPNADLTGHYVAGTLNMRLDKIVNDFPGTGKEMASYRKKAILHATFVAIGFLVVLPLGSLIARWGRTVTPLWFKAHQVLNLYLALPLITTGFLLGPLAVLDRQASHFVDAHQICGLLLFGLYIAQLSLGQFIHSKRAVAGHVLHPPRNILHVVVGITIICLAFLQVRSGFTEWASRTGTSDVAIWLRVAWIAWAVLLPCLYLSGLALLNRQFISERMGGSYDFPLHKNYIALAATPGDESRGHVEPESRQPLLERDQE
ncbi:Cytochrome b561 domain-containing protein [Mycena indigotica]|uniref:Cytochrome b561 domain-containing protein n=1 Tax=Mycena indigotica TaxID=2126181 RepID=A0A8H6S8W8_9AGAR|nr:Cytochrome b561 domain-containing protein [Mycena indigotica]KAF7295101.1 Cytochrome b561 domain-containing protein [Mycena indigotica]